ncbi:MAG: hypothetical protein GY928_33910 [Colwellia sp.]|nr:hypothetical protein [Colwellia sp.]
MPNKSYTTAMNEHRNNTSAPYGFVQWKATNVFCELNCECGETSFYDGWFMYTVECPHCKAKYFVPFNIPLVKIQDTEGIDVKVAIVDLVEHGPPVGNVAYTEQGINSANLTLAKRN